jgi:hypothetical protein
MNNKLTEIIVLLIVFAISFQLQAQTQSPSTALQFDGTTNSVNCGNVASLNITGSITIEAWINADTWNDYYWGGTIAAKENTDKTGYDLRCGEIGRLSFVIGIGGAWHEVVSGLVMSTGVWNHVAGVYDGSTMSIYINGKLEGQQSCTGAISVSSQPLFIGNSPGYPTRFFDGKIDELSIWNYARSVNDIREDMYRAAPLADTGLKDYWQFNNGTGTTLTDMKGTATGTLNNMTNSNWVASTIPFAAGAVNTQVVSATGTVTYTGTNLSMNFTAKNGTDNIVVSRIDTVPNMNPTGVDQVLDAQYWVVNKFGSGTFDANLTFTLAEDLSPQGRIKLYRRNSNSDGVWTLVGSATSVDVVNKKVSFNGITSFGQFIVCHNFPVTDNFPGTALSFDGTTNSVNCGNAAGLNITGAITIEAWINANTWRTNYEDGTIVGKDNGTAGYVLRCGNNGRLDFNFHNDPDNHEVLSEPIMSTGVWTHVAGVSDGSTFSIYINGKLARQQANSGPIGVSSQSLLIGNSPGYPTRFFDGKIDEVRIWNVARTAAQIQSDMLNTLAGTETGLVSYWQFNDGSGTTLTDVVGLSNGTLQNMTNANWVESYAMVVPIANAATNKTTTGFTANWTAPSIGTVESYKLYVATDNGFTNMVSGYPITTTDTSYAITGLSTAYPYNYYYRVKAEKSSVTGQGTYSDVIGIYMLEPPAGSGTFSDPYQIATLDNLYWLSANSGAWNMNYIQTADINASQTRNWNSGGISTIGSADNKFTGSYHGKGHTIDSLYMNRPNDYYVGLFGYIQPSSLSTNTIDSLSLTNIYLNGQCYVGGIAGRINSAIVAHCSVSGNIICNSNYAGNNDASSGGLIGLCISSNVNHCYSSANVNCNNSSETQYIGSLIGVCNNSSIKQCYSYGLVTASPSAIGAGGFIGRKYNSSTLDSCYWDNVTSGQTLGIYQDDQLSTTDLHGKSTADMKTQSTYIGWDFNTDWFIAGNANNGYPCFYYSPELSPAAASNIANNTATANGSIIRIGTYNPSSYGICWNTTGTPTITDSKVNLGAASIIGDFSANMTNLIHNTTYYVRAYATDQQGTVYGNQINFTTTIFTQAGNCLHNLGNGNVNIPDNNTLDLTNNYTIETWIKPEIFNNLARVIVEKGNTGYYLKNTVTGNSRGLNFDGMTTADNILELNKWYHVAAVNDNGTRHLYLNGIEQPLTGTAITVAVNSDPLYISNHYTGINYKYLGWIDEVRLWNIALSYSQLRENMHLPLTLSETGLVSYWQFDEGSGTIIIDKMGVNNGTYNYAWATSTIPFGNGFSNTQVVSTNGTNNFTNTGLSMNFTAKTGLDSIVVAKIDTFPNFEPNGLNAIFGRQYWVVHKYGNGTLNANLTFTLNDNLTAEDQNIPTKIKLYKRGSTADDASWVYAASAVSVNAATHQVTFNGITDFGQYILARGICTVNIPDANFKTALLAIPGLDANSDGEISCIEAYNYTGEINVNSKNISDMTGIEAFTNITKLYCNNNNLTSLNISALTLLVDLDCGTNQLTALNVSNNTALVNLLCGSNLLSSLNVSALTSLNYLICRYNQLTSLNVLSNLSLIGLYCNNNLLTNLNVNGLTSLARITCEFNQLTNLDFSSNTALLALDCSNNLLTSLNLKNGNNTIISNSNFEARNNPDLTCIQVDDAAYSSANWTNKDAGASYNTNCTSTVVPENYTLSNRTFLMDEIECFNAYDTITVAGGGTLVTIESGASFELIAGKSIRFLPGFWAKPGSFVDAHITSDSTFCDGHIGGSPIVEQPVAKSAVEQPAPGKQTVVPGIKSVKLYPNPNNGRFTISLTNIGFDATISVYNVLGSRVYNSSVNNQTDMSVNLPELQKGIYFVKVADQKEQFTKKMIVN